MAPPAFRERLIAHRGEPDRWPENSIEGFRAALEAGARFIEADVQLSADGIPLLCHDASLRRMTGHDLQVTRTDFETIRALPAGMPERFGQRFAGQRIASVAELAELIAAWPEARCFVEFKATSLLAFGVEQVVERVLATLGDCLPQCIAISFELSALHCVRTHTDLPVGWVLPEWSPATEALARDAVPSYLFVNRRRLPKPGAALWPGDWQWVAYTVDQAREAADLLAHGFDLVETNRIGALIGSAPRVG